MPIDSVLTTTLLVIAAALGAAAVAFMSIGVYSNWLEQFVGEVQEGAVGSPVAAGNIIIKRLGVLNRGLMWPAYENRVRRMLIRGGLPQTFAPEDILALQEIGLVLGLLLGLAVANTLDQNLVWAVPVAILGLMYPLIWVRDQVTKRHLAITRALPFNLDLLTLSVEAGLDFTAALDTVVKKGKAGPLRDELSLVLKQLKMGKTREEALKSMIARVDLPSLTQFVTALLQADRMGTSLGKVLRIQSTQLRVERSQRAEKLANEAPVKMLFPLIACIFPTVFMVLFGPIVFAFMFNGAGQ